MGLTQRLGLLADVFQPDSSLNVGIGGAANASYKLQVTGTTNLTGALTGTTGSFTYADNAYGAGITVTNSTNNTAAQSKINIANSAGNMLALIQNSPSVNSGVAYIGTSGAYSLTIGTNYATNLTIASTGAATFSSSVTATSGIFTQSAGQSLQVYQTSATNSTTAVIRQTGAGGNGGQDIGLLVDIQGANDLDNIANFRYYNGSTYTSRMVVKRGGNVGIGTSNPQRQFVIANSSGDGLEISNSSGYSTLLAYNRTTSAYQNIVLTEGTGKVLIGTTTDNGYKLQVNGTAQSTSFITASGTASIITQSSGWSTFYTVSNYNNAIYLVTLQLNGYSNYTAYATICQNDSALVIVNQYDSTAKIQVSGLNIQGTQNSGSTQTMVYKVIRIQ